MPDKLCKKQTTEIIEFLKTFPHEEGPKHNYPFALQGKNKGQTYSVYSPSGPVKEGSTPSDYHVFKNPDEVVEAYKNLLSTMFKKWGGKFIVRSWPEVGYCNGIDRSYTGYMRLYHEHEFNEPWHHKNSS